MENLDVRININPTLYSKDPESSELGKHIVCKSIEMINSMGFEAFTFKKLGEAIGSNESSVYRYFANKHTLLIYLVNWYWSWMDYKIVLQTANINDPKEKIKLSVELISADIKQDSDFSFINEILLNKIIIMESSKAYHNKDIDSENEKGFFKTYKHVVQRVSEFILEYNPKFEFPHMLISTVIEGAHNQRFFAAHLPSLTDFKEGKNSITRFYTNLVFNAIM
ncbi:MAG: TetR family transcriptional regulator [Formosa sp.]|jgi:AcrR family transcriptional regulator|nr:TetR family transcriptional regulator [Formosa sp.]|tara:strand:+ start:126 stop:794 length:669 start_codon:yes stop_codon:yes gene_type:complete